MKSYKVIAILGITGALLFAGCAKKENSAGSTTASGTTGEQSTESTASTESTGSTSTGEQTTSGSETDAMMVKSDIKLIDGDYKLEDIMTMGNYKGLTVEKPSVKVTDADLINEMNYKLSPPACEDPNAVVEKGDKVNLSFEGKINGTAFDGGTSDSYDLLIGSGSFIDGFEDGMLGMKVGEERDLNLKFPADYGAADLAGKDVVFHVKVKSISRYNDAHVKENVEGCSTVKEFEEQTRKELEQQAESNAAQELQYLIWDQIYDITEFKALPRQLVEDLETTNRAEYEAYAKNMGMSLEDFAKQNGMTSEQMDNWLYNRAVEVAKSRLIQQYIMEKENMKTGDEEYKAKLNEVAALYSMTPEELIEARGQEAVDTYVNGQRMFDRLISYANVTESVDK